MYFFINMQDSTLTAQNNIKEYAGPPLAGSSMPAQPAFLASAPNPSAVATPPIQNRINDIDYQLVSDFRDTIPTTQENSQVNLGATDPQQNAQVNNSTTNASAPVQNVVDGSVVRFYQPSAVPPINIAAKVASVSSIQELLSLAVEKGASDLHLSVGYPPLLRINGDLVPVPVPVLTDQQILKLFSEVLQDRQKQQLQNYLDIDFSYTHQSGNRFRINIFYKQGQLAGAFRLIPSQIRTIADLGMPSVLQDFTNVANGLILITGPTGSGKSTTIASVIQEINLNQPRHVITIEDPIEYVFPRAKALVNQREVGRDVRSWTRGLREILREDPDVVLVGEMRDYETIAMTITAAETGHLVLSTLHTNSASQTIDRIIDVFPDVQQAQIRAQLANVIHAVVSQRLIPVKSGGRRAVSEIMIATPAIRNAIREKKTYQIDNMIQTGYELGMVSLEKSLVNLIRSGEITLDEAQAYTVKHNDLISLLKQN